MAGRQGAQQDQTGIIGTGRLQGLGDRLMSGVGVGNSDTLSERTGPGRPPTRNQGLGDGRQVVDHAGRSGRQLGRGMGQVQLIGIDQDQTAAGLDRLTQAMGQQWLLLAKVTADDQHRLLPLQFRHTHTEPGPVRVGRITAEVALAQPVIDVGTPEPPGDGLGQIHLLQGRIGGDQPTGLVRLRGLEAFGDQRQGLVPRDGHPDPVALDHGLGQPVRTVQAHIAEAIAIRDPGLVDRLVFLRVDAHHLAAADMEPKVRADPVVGCDAVGLGEFPGPGGEAVGFGGESPDRAQVDDVTGQLV